MDFFNLRMFGRGFLGILIRLILQKPHVVTLDTSVTSVTQVIPVMSNTPLITEPSTQQNLNSGSADDSFEVVCARNNTEVFTFKSAIPAFLYRFQVLLRQLHFAFPHYSYIRLQSLVAEYPANIVVNRLNRLKVLGNGFTFQLARKLSAFRGNGLTRYNHQRMIAYAIINRMSRPVPPSSKKIGDFPGHNRCTFKVAFSPNRKICAITSWSTVKICKVENGNFICLHVLKHNDRAVDVKFHPTLPYFVVCAGTATIYRIMDNGTFEVVNIIKAKRFETATVRIPHGDFFSASFHPSNRFIALGCENWCIYLYSFTDQDCTEVQRLDRTHESQMTGHYDTVDTINFHSSGRFFVSGSDDRSVKVWQEQSSGLWTCVKTINDYNDYVRAVVFDLTGQFILATSCDNTIHVYETETWRCLQTIQTEHTKGISSCEFYPSDTESIFATGSCDGTTVFHRLSNDGSTSELLDIIKHPSGVYSLTFDQTTRSMVVGLCMNSQDRKMNTVELYKLPQ